MPEGTATAAAEPTRASLGRRDADRPYAPSWLDLVFDWLAGLPGPTWLAYLVLLVPGIALSNAQLWLSDLLPWGQLDPIQVVFGSIAVIVVAASHYLRNVAGSAFDAFRPALGSGVADPERARYELTVMPSRAVLGLTVFTMVLTPVYYAADPVAAQVVGLSPLGLVARTAVEGLVGVVVLLIAYQAVRQMRQVGRLHALATNVDPFRPAPLHAFSRLTAQVAAVVILVNTVQFVANPDAINSQSLFGFYLPWFLGFLAASIVVFLVPLLGMHRRLESIKGDLQGASSDRLRDLLMDLDQAIDGRDTARAEGLDKAVAALQRKREVLGKLPTWPWSTGTIRGFGSALFLPILLFLVQRVLGQLLG